MIVKTMPSSLSEGAKLLYSIAMSKGMTLQHNADWEREYRVGGKSVKADPQFIPELVEAGLATSRTSHFNDEDHLYLWIFGVHEEYAHITDGSDSHDSGMYAEVYVSDVSHGSGVLLLTMFGATIRNEGGNQSEFSIPTMRVSVRHSQITDEEHDSSYVADLEIMNPTLSDVSDMGQITVLGILGSARYYPRDTPIADEDSEMCDGEKYCRRGHAHPIANFTPPENENLAALSGMRVKVKMTPRRMIDANGSLILLDEYPED